MNMEALSVRIAFVKFLGLILYALGVNFDPFQQKPALFSSLLTAVNCARSCDLHNWKELQCAFLIKCLCAGKWNFISGDRDMLNKVEVQKYIFSYPEITS